jgi:hypothetical protein
MEARYYLYKFKDHLSLIHCHHFTGPFNLLLKAMLFKTLHLQTKKRDHAADKARRDLSSPRARRKYESLFNAAPTAKERGTANGNNQPFARRSKRAGAHSFKCNREHAADTEQQYDHSSHRARRKYESLCNKK